MDKQFTDKFTARGISKSDRFMSISDTNDGRSVKLHNKPATERT